MWFLTIPDTFVGKINTSQTFRKFKLSTFVLVSLTVIADMWSLCPCGQPLFFCCGDDSGNVKASNLGRRECSRHIDLPHQKWPNQLNWVWHRKSQERSLKSWPGENMFQSPVVDEKPSSGDSASLRVLINRSGLVRGPMDAAKISQCQ